MTAKKYYGPEVVGLTDGNAAIASENPKNCHLTD
jgi:hypothetical protein